MPTAKLYWNPPEAGLLKLNVDGSFGYEDGTAGVGVALRDSLGELVMLACQSVRNCHNVLDAEILACEVGIRLALQWSDLPFTVECDSSEALSLFDPGSTNLSLYRNRITSVRQLSRQLLGVNFQKCSRDQNCVSRCLANVATTQGRTVCWLGEKPDFLVMIVIVLMINEGFIYPQKEMVVTETKIDTAWYERYILMQKISHQH